MSILHRLMDGPKRQSELMRLIDGVTQKVLLQQLREMEAHGLVSRRVFAVAPPRVEYAVSELGRELLPLAEALCVWGRRHAARHERAEDRPGRAGHA